MSKFKPEAFKPIDDEERELMDSIERDEWDSVPNLEEERAKVIKRDKSSLLNLSVWTEEDIQQIEEGRRRINEWRIPERPDTVQDNESWEEFLQNNYGIFRDDPLERGS